MKLVRIHPLFYLKDLLLLLSLSSTSLTDQCQPATWNAKLGHEMPTIAAAVPKFTPSVPPREGPLAPGEVNCRNWGKTYTNVNYYTCTELADRYGITIETFFLLNPTIKPDCGNIAPMTKYCVSGFIEPLRSPDGRCGPQHQNATCNGTGKECCNSETWTCGDTIADCADGTCYEGICPGHDVYTTDGTCGYSSGNRLCAGKWGDCCNMNGKCGTGVEFCGANVCQSGNCTASGAPTGPGDLPWQTGNSTDGTCGGPKAYTCDVIYGNCCNKNGICGSMKTDCGAGCQPAFGQCDKNTTSSSLNSVTSSPTLSVSSTSSSTSTSHASVSASSA